jgi:hypothetical protein
MATSPLPLVLEYTAGVLVQACQGEIEMVDGCPAGQHFQYFKAERRYLIAGGEAHARIPEARTPVVRWSFERTGSIGAARGHQVSDQERK